MKFGLFALLLAASWLMYDNRALVVDAYQPPDSNVDIRLTGIDLDIEVAPLPPSPFAIADGADTRRRPLELAYVEPIGEPVAAEVAMDGGTSMLSGTSTAGSRVVEGAVVGIERHTPDGVGLLMVPVDEDGRWLAENLPGGRYRVRSWAPGVAVDRAASVFFLEDGSIWNHAFRLDEVEERPTVRLNNSGAMFDGLAGSVGVTVSRRQVDLDGRLVNGPVAGARVALQVSGAARLESSRQVTVNASGHATFRLRCTRPGPVSVRATVEVPDNGPRSAADQSGSTDRTSPRTPGLINGTGASSDSDSNPGRLRRNINDGGPSVDVFFTSDNHPGCRRIPPPPTTARTPTTATTGNAGQPSTSAVSTTVNAPTTTTTVEPTPTTTATATAAAGDDSADQGSADRSSADRSSADRSNADG